MDTKHCLSAHPLLHTALGAGLALIAVALVPRLMPSAFLLGVVFVAAGFLGELVGTSKRKSTRRR